MSENIVLIECQGAHDGALEVQCWDCKKRHHIAQDQEIVSARSSDEQKYGLIEFTLADGRKVINQGPIL